MTTTPTSYWYLVSQLTIAIVNDPENDDIWSNALDRVNREVYAEDRTRIWLQLCNEVDDHFLPDEEKDL